MEHTAQNIMSKKLMTISFLAKMQEAQRVMLDRNIRHLPVVDALGDVIGIVSDRDLCRAMTPNKEGVKDSQGSGCIDPQLAVKDYMSWPVRSVAIDAEIGLVAKQMLDEKISAFLVVDEYKHPTGIVTTDDMLRLLIRLLSGGGGQLKLSLGSVLSDFSMSPGSWV